MYLDLDAERLRSRLLGPLWRDTVDVWRDIDVIRNVPAARRLLDAGADPHDVSVAMCAAALDAVFIALGRLDDGGDWCLVRTDEHGRPTAQPLHGLRADLLSQDPSGQAGVDLRR